MGDVAGQELLAAVIMGRMRSALRAYALEFDDPAEVSVSMLTRDARRREWRFLRGRAVFLHRRAL
jgi:sigma-B regulation protein RsbU (phosphoserine phosphatase)